MTAGYQTVLVAATAFWLAVRHLLKAGSLRVGVAVHQQESSSDRPLPVSISGDGCTDRVSVTDRAETCVTGFRLVDPASQQQRCRLCSSWESGSSRVGFEGSRTQMGCAAEPTAVLTEATSCRRCPHWISNPSGQQVHQQSVRRLHCGGYRAPTHAAWNALMHALWGNTSLPPDETPRRRPRPR